MRANLDYAADFEKAMQYVVTLSDVGKSELEALKCAVSTLADDPKRLG